MGPFKEQQKEAVLNTIRKLTTDFEPEFEPEFSEAGNEVCLTVDFGAVNYGTFYMAEGGRIEGLIELKVPYVLRDDGNQGFRTGQNFSWHPEYGDVVRYREEDGFGNVALTAAGVARLGPMSNEEFGKGVRAYFAIPGSKEASAGWPVWDDDSIERKRSK